MALWKKTLSKYESLSCRDPVSWGQFWAHVHSSVQWTWKGGIIFPNFFLFFCREVGSKFLPLLLLSVEVFECFIPLWCDAALHVPHFKYWTEGKEKKYESSLKPLMEESKTVWDSVSVWCLEHYLRSTVFVNTMKKRYGSKSRGNSLIKIISSAFIRLFKYAQWKNEVSLSWTQSS